MLAIWVILMSCVARHLPQSADPRSKPPETWLAGIDEIRHESLQLKLFHGTVPDWDDPDHAQLVTRWMKILLEDAQYHCGAGESENAVKQFDRLEANCRRLQNGLTLEPWATSLEATCTAPRDCE